MIDEMSGEAVQGDNLFSSENVDGLSPNGQSDDIENGGICQRGRARAGVREKTAAPGQTDAPLWALEPHICRSCFSRLVSQDAGDGSRRYQCTNCGLEAQGQGAEVVCCCGIQIRRPTKSHKSGHHLVDAGVRCAPNPDVRPDFPSLFIASEPEK